ncbi:hypothetical protein CIB48_g9572 [Xylaria polymorpha]|nr:hypothetical protein CIB48_g9572 [Xylaria polymorpha]
MGIQEICELGFGTWSRGTEEVPATKDGELLACLDLTNPVHPVLSPLHKDNIAPEKTQIHPESQDPPEPQDAQEAPGTAVACEHEHLNGAPSSRTSCDEFSLNANQEPSAQDGQAVSHRDRNGTESDDANSVAYALPEVDYINLSSTTSLEAPA